MNTCFASRLGLSLLVVLVAADGRAGPDFLSPVAREGSAVVSLTTTRPIALLVLLVLRGGMLAYLTVEQAH